MGIDSNNQLIETRRLAALLLEVVNIAEKCVEKLKKGFIEPVDMVETKKTIKQLQISILQIDAEADEKLDGQREQ